MALTQSSRRHWIMQYLCSKLCRQQCPHLPHLPDHLPHLPPPRGHFFGCYEKNQTKKYAFRIIVFQNYWTIGQLFMLCFQNYQLFGVIFHNYQLLNFLIYVACQAPIDVVMHGIDYNGTPFGLLNSLPGYMVQYFRLRTRCASYDI